MQRETRVALAARHDCDLVTHTLYAILVAVFRQYVASIVVANYVPLFCSAVTAINQLRRRLI